MKGKYIITADNWFYAPDGKQYKAVWGDVQVVEDSFLGIKTNRNSTNWYLKIGTDENHVIVAGCQIHYAVKCPDMPNPGMVDDWQADGKDGCTIYKRPTVIYIAE